MKLWLVAVFQIMGNIYIYFRAGVALAVIFLAVNDDDSFGLLAFVNDHDTWSGLHGYVEENHSASGSLISITLHFHCLGANALLRNPQTQVTLRPDPSGLPGRFVGEDHRGRRVRLVLFLRRETFSSEAALREYMTHLRHMLTSSTVTQQDFV